MATHGPARSFSTRQVWTWRQSRPLGLVGPDGDQVAAEARQVAGGRNHLRAGGHGPRAFH